MLYFVCSLNFSLIQKLLMYSSRLLQTGFMGKYMRHVTTWQAPHYIIFPAWQTELNPGSWHALCVSSMAGTGSIWFSATTRDRMCTRVGQNVREYAVADRPFMLTPRQIAQPRHPGYSCLNVPPSRHLERSRRRIVPSNLRGRQVTRQVSEAQEVLGSSRHPRSSLTDDFQCPRYVSEPMV
jgi:hypothetical protein